MVHAPGHAVKPSDRGHVVVGLFEMVDGALEAEIVREVAASGGEIFRPEGMVVTVDDLFCAHLCHGPEASRDALQPTGLRRHNP